MAYRCCCAGGAAAATGRGAEAATRDSDAEVEGDHDPKAQRSEVSIYRSVTVTSTREASFFLVCAPRSRRSKRRTLPPTSVSVRFGSVRFGSVRFGSVRIGSVRCGATRLGSFWFGSVRSIRLTMDPVFVAAARGYVFTFEMSFPRPLCYFAPLGPPLPSHFVAALHPPRLRSNINKKK